MVYLPHHLQCLPLVVVRLHLHHRLLLADLVVLLLRLLHLQQAAVLHLYQKLEVVVAVMTLWPLFVQVVVAV